MACHSIVSPGSSIYYHDQAKYSALEKGINMTDHYQLFLVSGLERVIHAPDYQTLYRLYGSFMVSGRTNQAGNFFTFTPAKPVHNHPHGFFLALIS
ncbi:tannase and feruloyl esterase [Penicillium frequentans]|nr:tannase and feruloyl esterase [Penicillium glabrum]